MLSTLNLKRAKPNDLIESSDQSAIAIAPGAEESCPAPDSRASREPSLRMEPRFTASAASTPIFTASDFTAERMVPQTDIRRPLSLTDTEHLTPRAETEHLVPRSDTLFPPTELPAVANDIGPADDQPSIRLDSEPSAFGRAMKRAVTGLVIMLAGAVATVGWKTFGDDAKQLAQGLTQQMPLVSWLHLKHHDTTQTSGAASAASATPAETADASAQAPQDTTHAADTSPADSSQQATTPPAGQQAAPQQPAPQQAAAPQPQPAAPASTDTTATTAAVAAPSPDVTQLTQSVQALTREVAALQKNMAELKTNNEQMAREIGKINERNTARRAAVPPRPATPSPTAQVQRPAPLPPVQSAVPRPVSQYQPPARPYPVTSQEASAPPPPVVYSQQPTSAPPSYAQPRTYSDPSGYADSSPAPRPPASVGGY